VKGRERGLKPGWRGEKGDYMHNCKRRGGERREGARGKGGDTITKPSQGTSVERRKEEEENVRDEDESSN